MANGYKKLASGGNSLRLMISRISLWQGPDHLLQIERVGHNEEYKRFYFADIECVVIRRDKRYATYMVILGILLLLMGWIAVVTAGFGRGFSLFWVFFFLIPFVINLARGPTCRTHLTTAVQHVELPPLRRVRQTQKALWEVLAAVRAAQGDLPLEEARMRFQLQNAAPLSGAPPPLPGGEPVEGFESPPPPLIE